MKDIKRLFKYLKPYKSSIIVSLFCNALTAIFTVISIPLIMPFFQLLFRQNEQVISIDPSGFEFKLRSFFLDLIQNNTQQKAILLVCGMIAVSFLLKNLFRYLALYFMIPTRSGVISDLRGKIFQKVIYSPRSFFKKYKKGDLMTRISADTLEIEWSILQFLQVLVQSPLIVIGSIAFMLMINTKLTLMVFVLMLVIGLVLGNISKTLKKQSSSLQGHLANIMSTADEAISGILSIKSFQAESTWKGRFEKSNKGYRSSYAKFLKRRDLSSPVSEFLGILIVTILLWWGSNLVLDNEIAPDTFFAFILAFYFVIEPLKSFSSAFYNLKKGIAALDRIEELGINEPEADAIALEGAHTLGDLGDIVFENLSFKFEDAEDYLLQNINLTIEQGKMTALIGPSGSGKTSLLMLLLKIYEPNQGRILINGVDLRKIDRTEWLLKLGYLPQDAFLFNDSIRSNILFGRKATKEEIEKGINLAFASDFIDEKEGGLEYSVGDKGDQLSGGEKQRINIARALLKNPELLLMDEPTASLDAHAESKINSAIKHAANERTSLVIAHRLSTIKDADQIIMIENGVIKDQGTHDHLLSKSALYKQYINLQLI